MTILQNILKSSASNGSGISKIISVAADFPTDAEVASNPTALYGIAADVTDNDPAKTNTGESFTEGDIIFYDAVDSKYVKTTAPAPSWGAIVGNISSQTDLQIALSGKENTFAKNTAFNKDFGTTAGTVAQGNDSRIVNALPKTLAENNFFTGNSSGAAVAKTPAEATALLDEATILLKGLMSATDKAKLNGIEAGADVTDAANIASSINGAAAKAVLVDEDLLAIVNSESANALAKVTISDLVYKTGQSDFFYIKASASIAKGQLCYFTGTVGASGVIQAAPAGASITNPQFILGFATSDLNTNDFGYVQTLGVLEGLDTSAFNDNDILYYDSVNGGVTATYPSTGIIVSCAAVVNSNNGNGIIAIRPQVTQRINAGTGISVTQTESGSTITNTGGSGGAAQNNIYLVSANSTYTTVAALAAAGKMDGSIVYISGNIVESSQIDVGDFLNKNIEIHILPNSSWTLANGNGIDCEDALFQPQDFNISFYGSQGSYFYYDPTDQGAASDDFCAIKGLGTNASITFDGVLPQIVSYDSREFGGVLCPPATLKRIDCSNWLVRPLINLCNLAPSSGIEYVNFYNVDASYINVEFVYGGDACYDAFRFSDQNVYKNLRISGTYAAGAGQAIYGLKSGAYPTIENFDIDLTQQSGTSGTIYLAGECKDINLNTVGAGSLPIEVDISFNCKIDNLQTNDVLFVAIFSNVAGIGFQSISNSRLYFKNSTNLTASSITFNNCNLTINTDILLDAVSIKMNNCSITGGASFITLNKNYCEINDSPNLGMSASISTTGNYSKLKNNIFTGTNTNINVNSNARNCTVVSNLTQGTAIADDSVTGNIIKHNLQIS